MRPTHQFRVAAAVPANIDPIRELAENLHWCWDRRTLDLFDRLAPDRRGWRDRGTHPIQLVSAITSARWSQLADDDGFVEAVRDAQARLTDALEGPTWFGDRSSPLELVAYFSPEFGITEAIAQYSGGLGVLAGDHLKASSDLGIPLVGVGLLYSEGYFHQHLDSEGWQEERNERVDPASVAIVHTGIHVTVDLAGVAARVAVWKAQVGRVPLYLLDTNVEGNPPEVAAITDRLYGGDEQHRLRQEIVLGIGGVRALRALDLHPQVFHMNEGHAGFLGLERIREAVFEGASFSEAVEAVRAGAVFTTHTPVPAGIDRFPRELFQPYFEEFAASCGVEFDELFALGQRDDEPDNKFNMAVMGLRLAARANGVARLHGEVSRDMFGGMWPELPHVDTPIGHVTNGVHARSWVSDRVDELISRVVGDGWHLAAEDDWSRIHEVDHHEIWEVRNAGRRELVDMVRHRLGEDLLDSGALTIGFARRFATYKRATLLVNQAERLVELLGRDDRPVQFVFAGKAHPADSPGKELIKAIDAFTKRADARHRFVFLPDYDIGIARTMYHGCDVWLNTPRRPMEACGTSGMKAALNGCINLSIRDGWWDEMSDGTNGWDIPSFDDDIDLARRDLRESNATFQLIEKVLIPLFYGRGDDGVPHGWIERVVSNWSSLGWKVTASRMVRDYVEGMYEPAATSATALGGTDRRGAKELAAWKSDLPGRFAAVRVHVDPSGIEDCASGSLRSIVADVDRASFGPDELVVELVHGPVLPSGDLDHRNREVITLQPDADGRYHGTFSPSGVGPWGVLVRALPYHHGLASVYDTGLLAIG